MAFGVNPVTGRPGPAPHSLRDGDKAQARQTQPAWARSIRDQCRAAGVPFFWKQWGQHMPAELLPPVPGAEDTPWRRYPDGSERWALNELGVPREKMERVTFESVGKKAAGRYLDGRLHNEFPIPRAA